jgi:hypothetical protein
MEAVVRMRAASDFLEACFRYLPNGRQAVQNRRIGCKGLRGYNIGAPTA